MTETPQGATVKLWELPKPLEEMTDEEIDAFAEEVAADVHGDTRRPES